jgi:hypothetical protein
MTASELKTIKPVASRTSVRGDTPHSTDVTALGFRGTRYEYHDPNQQEQNIVNPYKIITAFCNGNMRVNK